MARTKPTYTSAGVKLITVSVDIARYIGHEPQWEGVEITEKSRRSLLLSAFNWYNYMFASKDAIEFIVDYLKHNDREKESKLVKRAPDSCIANGNGWMARMALVGWELSEEENAQLESAIAKAIQSVPAKVVVDNTTVEDENVKKFNIQERMREKAAEAGGEVEGLVDAYIAAGCKANHKLSPINVLKAANILPAHAADEIKHWEDLKAEFTEAHRGKDADLVEAYSFLNKIQLRNLIKFCELIIADYHGYVAFKKATKKTRKRKVKSPVELVRKLKYLPEFKELGLTSVKPTEIVGAKEMFVYDTKKRKLMYFVADEHATVMTVRNNTIEGFDVVKTMQKTVRKPDQQLKEFMKVSKPNSRKFFQKMKSVEQKVSGRFNENVVILKVW